MSHNLGELLRLSVAFTNLAGTLTDPNTVTLTTRSPAGVITVYLDAINDATAVGAFYKDVTPLEAGVWSYQWAGSGNLSAIEEATFTVAASTVGATGSGLYASVADLKPMVDIEESDTADDALLVRALAASSTMVNRACRRRTFFQDPVVTTRYYTAMPGARGNGSDLILDIDDISTSTGLVVTNDGTAVTDFELEPVNAAAESRPWTRLYRSAGWTLRRNGVGVVARHGWPLVPEVVPEATLLQASRLFERRHAPFGIAGSPETGSELRLLARVDPDVAVMLRGVALR